MHMPLCTNPCSRAEPLVEPPPDLPISSRVLSPAEFETLRLQWNALVFAAARPNPFLTWEWLQAWLETSSDAGPAPWLLTVWRGHELVGGAALCREGKSVRFLAVRELDADYTDLLALPECEEVVVEAITRALLGSDDWTRVILEGFSAGALVERLAQGLARSASCERITCDVCPALELGATWEDVLKRRFDGKRRYNVQREMRLAAGRHALTVRAVKALDELPEAMDTLFQLHDMRKALQQVRSRFAEGRNAKFHRRVAARFQEAGWLALDVVEQRDRPVAAQYGFRFGRRFWLYQTGLDPRGAAAGAGTFALASRILESANDGLEEFDFLRGDEAYKRLWADRHTALWTVLVFRAGFRGWVAHSLSTMRRAMGRVLRQIRSWRAK
jgi:CelD/BcsL family acetyltransferase involved in cellulose biosynthesis